jgi:dTDP-4-amino-4,6-dideoxygalactose transaminase
VVSAPRWIVPLSDVVGDDELVQAAADAVRSGWWSTGPRVAQLEAEFADTLGSRHAIAVANGTAALQLAFVALGVGQGDEVVTPSLTFVAAANAVRQTGADAVFCDIAGGTDLNLDPADVEAAITPRTKAICVLHYGGFACAIDDVLEIAERHDLTVVEDAAHAVGSRHAGRACGTFGAIGCFSFFSNKNLPIGEGGMVVTDDDALAARLRLLRSHGMTTLTWDRHRGHASTYDVVEVGFNYRLDEIRAALASVQLRRLADANARRAALADRYVELLHEVDGVEIAFADQADRADSAHHLAVALLPSDVDREELRQGLTEAGIQTSVHYPPIHGFTAYAGVPVRPLPRTDDVAPRLLTLPLYPALADESVELVASRLLDGVREARSSREGHSSRDVPQPT